VYVLLPFIITATTLGSVGVMTKLRTCGWRNGTTERLVILAVIWFSYVLSNFP